MESHTDMPKLGKNIANIRKSKNISLEELANRSGVSKGMISQIEQEKVNPTVAVVWKIAYGLDVPFQNLVVEGDAETLFNPLQKSDTVLLEKADNKCVFRILSPMYMAEKLEIYMLKIEKGGCLESKPHQDGTEEFITVLEGKASVEIGSNKSVMEPGDSIHYRADLEHTIRNVGDGICNIYMVVNYQN
jgi:transcriptional regulator with XRE-family HTH domain